eukprot:222277-Pyramimonas_sp.AAC.1
MERAGQVCVRSDGSFKREGPTGCSMRGAACARLGRCRSTEDLPLARRCESIAQTCVHIRRRR